MIDSDVRAGAEWVFRATNALHWMVYFSPVTRSAALRCGTDGRPLFAGHAGLDWPTEPHLGAR